MIKTRHFSVEELADAAILLRSNELVAFPTETVYGLGANALSASAVEKIFQAKGRPSDNPLIVHLASIDDVDLVADSVSREAQLLMDRFWPGPLTLVLSKKNVVPYGVTAGLDTVAVRVPSLELASNLIRLSGVPLAAPSANRSGRPSATTWQAVAEDLDGRISGIICGAPTLLGLESTVVDVSTDQIRILRPGGVSFEELRHVLPSILNVGQQQSSSQTAGEVSDSLAHKVNSPGLRHRHYQPTAKVILVDHNDTPWSQNASSQTSFFIGIKKPNDTPNLQKVMVCETVAEYASKLFDFFRQADLLHAEFVYCQGVAEQGMGAALMDRIRRACEE